MKRAALGLALGAAFLFLPGLTLAQQSGLFLGAAFNGSALSFEDSEDTENGGGVSAIIGYGAGTIAPYARLSAASMSASEDDDGDNDYVLGFLDLGARAGFPVGGLVPYLNGAFTVQLARFDVGDDTADYSGTGFTFGGGLLYFFGSAALDASVSVTSGKFTELSYGDESVGIETETTTARLDIGVTFFTRGRQPPPGGSGRGR